MRGKRYVYLVISNKWFLSWFHVVSAPRFETKTHAKTESVRSFYDGFTSIVTNISLLRSYGGNIVSSKKYEHPSPEKAKYSKDGHCPSEFSNALVPSPERAKFFDNLFLLRKTRILAKA
jgi:hypothetical protein